METTKKSSNYATLIMESKINLIGSTTLSKIFGCNVQKTLRFKNIWLQCLAVSNFDTQTAAVSFRYRYKQSNQTVLLSVFKFR